MNVNEAMSDVEWNSQSPPPSRGSVNSTIGTGNEDLEEGLSVDDGSQQSWTNLSQNDFILDAIHGQDSSIRPSSATIDSDGNWNVVNLGAEAAVHVDNINQDTNSTEPKHGGGTNSTLIETREFHTPTRHKQQELLVISPDSTKDTTFDDDEETPERYKSIRFSPTNQVHLFTPSPEEFIDNPSEEYKSYKSCGTTARLFFVVYALPFMHGFSSNITTLYLLIELTLGYEINSFIAGTYLVLAYMSRLSFASLSRVAPKSCVFVGSIVSLCGFSLIYLSQDQILLDKLNVKKTHGLTLFIVGSILSNTNETMSAMQVFVRDQYIHNVQEIGKKLKRHYLMAKLARIVSFGCGGYLYQTYGVGGLAVLGSCMVSLQILCLFIFLVLDNFREAIDPIEGQWVESKKSKKLVVVDCSIRAAIGRRRILSSSMSRLNRTIARYYPSSIQANILRTALPICVFGRTISSLVIWNVSALIMEDDFQQSKGMIGAVFAGIMSCDWIVTFLSMTDNWNTVLTIKLSPPKDLYAFMIGITLSLGFMAIPNFITFVVGLASFTIFNSVLRTKLYELQGSNNCGWESLNFQIIRRFWSAAALFSLPKLDALTHRLPMLLAIWFALSATTMLLFFTLCRDPNKNEDDEMNRNNNKSDNDRNNAVVTRKKKRPSKRPEKNLVYGERIMLSRLIKGKDV
jgi:hypothetical protein